MNSLNPNRDRSNRQSNDQGNGRIGAHIFISGRVQGVGYRASTVDAAALTKVSGWVRNLRDGRVEALFEGTAEQVEEMIQWCHKGPPAAVVENVQVDYVEPSNVKGFQVTR